MAQGRPSSYTPELAERICLRIAGGESLADITRDDGMPAYSTVTLWRRTNASFSALYAQAREDQADHEVDEIKAIADANPATVPVYDSNGNVVEVKIDTAFEAW